jgi:hypothetical protein
VERSFLPSLDHLYPMSDMTDEEMPALNIGEIQPIRRPQKDCLLMAREYLAIEPFKETYQSEPLRESRVAIMKSEILVAYFNYLDSQNAAPRSPEELQMKTKVWSFLDLLCTAVLTHTHLICSDFRKLDCQQLA